MVEETPFTAVSYLAWQPIRNHKASIALFWQLYKVRIITLQNVVFIDMTFYSTRISGCVMASQPAMKLREGTVYKVKFYVFLPENLEAGVAS